MGNALFRKLFHSVLMNEATGADASGAGGGSATTEGSDQAGSEQQPGNEVDGKPGDQKPEGENKGDDNPDGEGKQEGKKDEKPEGAPEKYDFTAAEGVELDSEALNDFEPVARDLNLTNEQAQKLVDAYPKILAGVQQRQAEAWQKQTEGWAEKVKADKDIGGDKLPANLSAAQRALDQFGTPELKEYLSATGLGNHPDLVKTFVKIGKAMSEDGMVTGSKTTTQSVAQRMYPNMNP